VLGHLGLTPQTSSKLGGFKVQGRDAKGARKIIDSAIALQEAGCFGIVLECIPDKVAGIISEKLNIFTLGIGAGPRCDGQVLVLHDLLGLYGGFKPKFVKQYADLSGDIQSAVTAFKNDVEEGRFPTKDFSFAMSDKEARKLNED
ncbi:MAG: 3-methyl-2-oxobutanoate hydroxymethyltransferase, partial [Candidatus Omnitrophica bacterium]|nr:3-methyl-2-oxobutanoate hydroxymethyltransferase [Candidatus Omnitrophota bacterium]